MNNEFENAFSTAAAPPSPAAPQPKKRRFKWFFRWVLGLSLLANMVTCSMVTQKALGGSREYPLVTETLAYGDYASEVKVAILSLEGPIMREAVPTLFGSQVDPVTRLLNEIQAVTMDEDVRAILLEVNSPGGGVTASDEIYNALTRFKLSRADRKILVHIQDMAASGGYYAAIAGDKIVAQPTSVVGSVGVILSVMNFHELSQKIGVKDVSLTSSDNKALMNPFEPVNPQHNLILQQMVDTLYTRFRDLVLENRPFDAEFADKFSLLDGRVFTGPEALDMGLIDQIGYGDTARKEVLELLGVENAAFVEVSFTGGFAGLFAVKSPELGLPAISSQAQFQYLWKP
jgi:protease-4